MNDTPDLVFQSFIKLLEAHTYKEVSISALCKAAGISRRTFYRWYNGIEDLVVALVRKDFIDPVRQTRSVLPLDEIKSSTLLMTERGINTVNENKVLYQKLLDYNGYKSLAETIIDETYLLSLEIFASYIENVTELEYAAYEISAAHAMVLDRWLRGQFNVTPKQLARFTTDWLYAHFKSLKYTE